MIRLFLVDLLYNPTYGERLRAIVRPRMLTRLGTLRFCKRAIPRTRLAVAGFARGLVFLTVIFFCGAERALAAAAFPGGMTANVVINGKVNAADLQEADAYDIDMIDNDAATIAALKQGGKKVICYFSAGSSEDWRDDYELFTDADKGGALDNWPGENWLNIRSENVRNIMKKRLDMAVEKGCDAVDPDNMDGYANDNGVSPALTAQDQLDYNRFLAKEAHARGLAIGLKNDASQAAELEPDFDFSVVESCFEYDECDVYSVFYKAGKAVFGLSYEKGNFDAMCKDAKKNGLSAALYDLKLDGSLYTTCEAPALVQNGGGTTPAAPQCRCRTKG